METEHRDEIRRGQRDGRQTVEVCAVGGVKVQRRHGIGKQRRVHRRRHSSAVFVRLNRHDGSLGPTVQARNGPCVGVGFLQLVAGPVHCDLSRMEPGAVLLQPARQRETGAPRQLPQDVRHLLLVR